MSRPIPRLRARSGQISILIIFSLVPLFTLFAFVVNLGMLVNAKIALQNAADLAAYAGAATQARQLTSISHINYEMREAYKRFIFRYYVIGNYALRCFPRKGGTPSGTDDAQCPKGAKSEEAFDWINPGPLKFPGVPVVCLDLSQDSNPCQLGDAVKLVTPPNCLPMDPVCEALQTAASQIQNIQLTACGAHKLMNFEIALQWLYSTSINATLNTQPALQELIRGPGLVPEEILHFARIETLQSYVNEPSKTVTVAGLNQIEEVADQARTERSVLAFRTVMGNLNQRVFDPGSVEMKELMPDYMLLIKKIAPDIEVPVVLFEDPNAGGTGNIPNSNAKDSCKLDLTYVSAKPIVGVYKVPDSTVFYAIKLKAKARLLFNPFPFGKTPDNDGIELTAYAAAKPFGSRIGPEFPEEMFYKVGRAAGSTPREIHYPFLPISEDWTYEHRGVLQAFASALRYQSQGTPQDLISESSLRQALNAAQFPDEVEVGKYNIPVNSETLVDKKNGMIRYFDLDKNSGNPNCPPVFDAGNPIYTLWAPILPPGGSFEELKERMKSEIEQNVSATTTTSTQFGTLDQIRANVSKLFLDQFSTYQQTLRACNNFNVARLHDPLAHGVFSSGGAPRPQISGKIVNVHSTALLASSYTTDKAQEYYTPGRDGYSVKFIAMADAIRYARRDDLKGEKADAEKVRH